MTKQEARYVIRKYIKSGDILNVNVEDDTITFELVKISGRCYYGVLESGQKPELEYAGMIEDFE